MEHICAYLRSLASEIVGFECFCTDPAYSLTPVTILPPEESLQREISQVFGKIALGTTGAHSELSPASSALAAYECV